MERFTCPTIRAGNYQQAEPKINQVLQLMTRMLNSISTGAGIPTGRVADGAITEDKLGPEAVTGVKVKDGEITAAKLTVAQLAAITAALGTVTSGKVQSADGKTYFDLTNNVLVVNDGTYDRGVFGKQNSNYGATFRDSAGNITFNLGSRSDAFSKIYDDVLTEAAATVTISSGLAGDTDDMYFIVATMKNAHDGGNTFFMTINNDTGNNYAWQTVYCVGAGAAGFTSAGGGEGHMHIGTADALNEVSQIFLILHAKSGFARIMNGITARQIVGTLVEVSDAVGYVWNNTSAEITRLDFFGEQASNFGIDTHFKIYKVPGF